MIKLSCILDKVNSILSLNIVKKKNKPYLCFNVVGRD